MLLFFSAISACSALKYLSLLFRLVRVRDEHIKAGVVGLTSKADAEHIAAATVAEVDILVSWNFKHIVHYEKIHGYQAVNLMNGYKIIQIYSPKEVVKL